MVLGEPADGPVAVSVLQFDMSTPSPQRVLTVGPQQGLSRFFLVFQSLSQDNFVANCVPTVQEEEATVPWKSFSVADRAAMWQA